jgi:hypothetical protein
MKKVMSCFSNHYDRIRLLALLLALAVATPVLLAEDGDHEHENDRNQNHERFVDPIVGSWIVHVHVTTFTPPLSHLPLHHLGVWKKVAPRTYVTKFLTVDPPALGLPPGTINTLLGGPVILNPQGTEMKGPFHGFDTDPTGKVIDQFSGTAVIDRINLTSNP